MPRFKPGTLLGPVLLVAGCNAVLGISDDPVVSAASTGCRDSSDCIAPQTCRSQVCSDPEPGQTAGNGGQGAGQGTNDGGAPEPDQGGSAGSGGEPAMPTPGEPCDDEGVVTCADNASPERVVCADGEYAVHEPCGEGELCDSSAAVSGSCAPVVVACQGRQPLEAFCEGQVRTQCGPDLVTIEQTTCDSVQLCNYGSGADCAACVPNQHHCSGETLQICNDDQTGYEDVMPCMDQPCNAEAGGCTIYACTPAGSQKCDENNNLVECAQNQMGFDIVEECGTGTCDPEDLECDVCTPDDIRCDSGSAFECSSDGQLETETVCQGDTPHCTASGCVECTGDAHCDPADDCHTAYCNVSSGECASAAKGAGAVCDGTGVCDANANCVECLNTADHCDEATEVCRGGACEDALAAIGFKNPIAGSAEATIIADTMYVLRLPPLAYDAELLALGFHGKSGTGSAKMALYGGDASLPSGAPLAESAVGLTWLDTVQELVPDQSPTLVAGNQYWLAIKTNADVVIRTQANASAVGRRYTSQTYSSLFPTLSTSGSAQNGSDWNLFISVRYIE